MSNAALWLVFLPPLQPLRGEELEPVRGKTGAVDHGARRMPRPSKSEAFTP
jgi:hypothetical protein